MRTNKRDPDGNGLNKLRNFFSSCVTEIEKYLIFSVLIFLAHSHLVQDASWSQIVPVAPAITSSSLQEECRRKEA